MENNPRIKLKIYCVNAAAKLFNKSIILEDVIELFRNVTYYSYQPYAKIEFVSINSDIDYPECKEVIIFKSGALVIRGAKNLDIAKKIARKVARRLQKNGMPVKLRDYRQTNIFTAFNVGHDLDLEGLRKVDPYKFSFDTEAPHYIVYQADPTSKGLKNGDFKETVIFYNSGRIKIITEDLVRAGILANLAYKFAIGHRQIRLNCSDKEQDVVKSVSFKADFEETDDFMDLLS